MVRNGLRRPGVLLWGVLLLFFAGEVFAEERRALVLAVLDGDTAVVRGEDGSEETVRYLHIDTPELHHPRRREEELGPEAREANRSLVEGRWVRLVTDVVPRDRYGRLLARVVVDSPRGPVDVCVELARRGLALPLILPPNGAGKEAIHRALKEAQQAGRGWWSRARGRIFSCAQIWAELPLVAGSFCVLVLRVDAAEQRPTRWVLREEGSRIIVTLPRDFAPDPRTFCGRTLRVWGKVTPSFSGGELAAADPLQIEVVDNFSPSPRIPSQITP